VCVYVFNYILVTEVYLDINCTFINEIQSNFLSETTILNKLNENKTTHSHQQYVYLMYAFTGQTD